MSDEQVNLQEGDGSEVSDEVMVTDEPVQETSEQNVQEPEVTEEVDYKSLYESTKQEVERKEQVITRSQSKLRQKDKYIQDMLSERADLANNVNKYKQGEVEELPEIPTQINNEAAFQALFDDFENGPPDDLVQNIVKDYGINEAMSFKQNWSTYDPNEIAKYRESIEWRNEMTAKEQEKSELERLREENAKLKETKAAPKPVEQKGNEMPEPLTNLPGNNPEGVSYEGKNAFDMTPEELDRVAQELKAKGLL